MSVLSAQPNAADASEPVNELFQELPPLLARGLVYLLLVLLTTAGIYSYFGTVNDVVRAPAVAVPQGLIRPVQAGVAGKVTRLVVREGAEVEKDQVLVYLETETAEAVLSRAREEEEIRERQLQDLAASQADSLQVAEARAQLAQARAAVTAAERTVRGSMIVAPMTGQLTRLHVNGVGEAVQAGQTVAEVAPTGAPLVFEARVANRDVGDLRIGLSVRLKVAAFPYQEYGTVGGTVTSVSPDAVVAPDGLSYYRVLIVPTTLPATRTDRKQLTLRLGLAATAEIVTARKRIAEYLIRTVRGEP